MAVVGQSMFATLRAHAFLAFIAVQFQVTGPQGPPAAELVYQFGQPPGPALVPAPSPH